MGKTLRIGTRRSPLALWQAEHIKALLEKHHPGLRCTLTRILTEGDKILEVSLARFGGKGLFVKAIEAMSQAIVNKILHDPVSTLKKAEEKGDTPGLVEAVRKLFSLGPKKG